MRKVALVLLPTVWFGYLSLDFAMGDIAPYNKMEGAMVIMATHGFGVQRHSWI
jgi:hypothetical protein